MTNNRRQTVSVPLTLHSTAAPQPRWDKMKKLILIILIVASTVGALFVVINNFKAKPTVTVKKTKGINPSARFRLSKEQLTEQTTKAKQGDGDAAFKLYQHFDMTTEDQKSSFFWLEKAAFSDHPIALYNIAHTYIYDEKYVNHEKAMYWLNRGVDASDPHVKELLERYKKKLEGKGQ